MEDSFLQDLEPRKRPMGGDFPKGSKKVKSLCLQRSYADGKQTTWSCHQRKRPGPQSTKYSGSQGEVYHKLVKIYIKNSWIFQVPTPSTLTPPPPAIPGTRASSRSLTSAGDGRFILWRRSSRGFRSEVRD